VRWRKYCYAALQRSETFSKLISLFFEICGPTCRHPLDDGGVHDSDLKISSA